MVENVTTACARTPDFHPDDRVGDGEPNRFDPYEALDTITERVEDIEDLLHDPPDPMACIGRLADVRGEVRALRAYITGMER